MRLWYKFLLGLLVFGLILIFVGSVVYFLLGEHASGSILVVSGCIVLGVLLFVASAYFERWIKGR